MVLVDDKKPTEPVAPKRRRRPQREALYRSPTYQALQHEIARAVVYLRERNGWTQEDAAHHAGMATRLWQRVEQAEANLSLVTIARVLEAFQIEPREAVDAAMAEIVFRKTQRERASGKP